MARACGSQVQAIRRLRGGPGGWPGGRLGESEGPASTAPGPPAERVRSATIAYTQMEEVVLWTRQRS